ncbi:MAG TPA: TIGR01777 family oxidoreductase, partial [Terracidiphilus sp.]|nr:TIGR01777 family oxidoreductase [Terracidiphilus sp.]
MSEETYKVVLSGASGMLGTALRRALSARQTPALQLVRGTPASSSQLAWNPEADPAIADSDALEGLAAAVHLSGASVAGRRWTTDYKQELAVSRVQSTQALARLLASLRHPPQTLLVASAVGLYGDRGEELLDESSLAGAGFLAQLCKEWEAAAQPAADAGIRVVNLRFGVVLGRGEGALAAMLPAFRLGLGGRLGTGRQWMSWISLQDAIGAILFAIDTLGLAGPVNLTAPNPVRNAEFTHVLGHQLNRPTVLPVPATALRLAFGQMADEALLAGARVVPQKLMAAGFSFTHATIDQAL